MNKIPTIPMFRILACSLIFTLCSVSAFSQGWVYSFGGTSGATFQNTIVHIPPFLDGKTFPLGNTLTDDRSIFHFSGVADEAFAGTVFTSGTSLPYSADYLPQAALLLASDTVFVLTTQYFPTSGQQNIFLHRFFSSTTQFPQFPSVHDWSKPLFADSFHAIGKSLIYTNDGNLIALGAIRSEDNGGSTVNELFLAKANLNGIVEWDNVIQNPGDDLPVQIIAAPDDGFWILGNSQSSANPADRTMRLTKVDALGAEEWALDLGLPNDVAYDMFLTSEGGLAITGKNVDQDLLVLKVTDNGTLIWRQDYPTTDRSMIGKGIIEDTQGNLVVAGEQQMDANSEIDPLLAKLTADGIPLWEKQYGKPETDDGFNDIRLTPAGQYLMAGYRKTPQGTGNFGHLVKTDTLGVIKGGIVHGNVFHDLNVDCMPGISEINLENWKVQVANDTLNFFGNTDSLGNYWIPVEVQQEDTMNYIVTLVPPSNYWEACANDIPVTLTYLDTVAIDFPTQSLVDCPFPQVEVGASALRRCEPASIFVNYCNDGTATAENATVEVTLDEYLTFEDANITPSQVDGQTYTFPLGDLAVNECGSFQIDVIVDCDSVELQNVVCIEAHITPDSLCLPEFTEWSGALLQLNYTCENDELRFNIENVGTAAMENALDYIIIEDAVLLMQGDFDLNPTESIQSDPLPVNGSTYHLLAPQEPGAPGPELISLGTMGCNGNHAPELNEFPQYSGDPFTVIHCPWIQGPYDPNDKLATPSGAGMDHEILPNTDLQYTIRFQNVGNDTAFRVIIKDTLSDLLDPATIVPGPSSHPFSWRLEDAGILTFNFYEINLPDSTTNLMESQGFVNFRIKQKRDLAPGSVIENSAAIYFDFNAPVITNTTFHTISDLLEIVSGSVTVADPGTAVKVMPNPILNGAWIQVEGVDFGMDELILNLYDLTGKTIRTLSGQGAQIWVDRGSLVPGMYFFTLEKAGNWQASGKLMVQ